jgi:hypothetical protein
MRITKLTVPVLLILVIFTAALCQAQSQSSPSVTDNYVTNTGFKNRVFDVQNRMPEDLVPVIRLLTSGFKGATLSASNEFRTITVRDFPENIAAIADAIKRLDTAEAKRPDIELHMDVLIASNKETGLNQYSAYLKDAIKELQTTLNYKDYYLLTSIVQRTRESRGERGGYLQGRGSAEINWPAASGSDKRNANYLFDASSVALASTPGGAIDIRLGNFSFSLQVPGGESRIHSDLTIHDGEKVVVGTAGFGDKALILVMTAKILK